MVEYSRCYVGDNIPPNSTGQAGCPRLSRFVGSRGGGCLGLVGMTVEVAVEMAVQFPVGRGLVGLLCPAITLARHLCGEAWARRSAGVGVRVLLVLRAIAG